jgi:RNA polymerase sigma-70 factor (ECF subfamily)
MFNLPTYSISAYAALVALPRTTRPAKPERMKAPVNQPENPEQRHQADAELLKRVAAADRSAFSELYDRFSRPLYATAVHILRDPAEAQDVVHDAFITLWEKAPSFESTRGTAFSWAVTLTRNRAIDRLRSRRRRAALLEGSAPSDLGLDENSSGPSADTAADSNDQACVVRAAVAALPLEQQNAVQLAFFGGLTQEEIAARLQAPLGTIKARIRRGLLKLREQLALRR